MPMAKQRQRSKRGGAAPTRGAAAPAGRNASELRILDEGWQRQAWHGPNLRAALRGVSAEQAAWRPGPGRHNIHELVRHAAYWTYMATRRLGHSEGRFAYPGTNWFPCPDVVDEAAWRADLALLEDQKRRLRRAVSSIEPPRRTAAVRTADSRLRLLLGVACHDIYHAGQVQLIKRLQTA
jgi:uncharacterized damage-inducible protein DinB